MSGTSPAVYWDACVFLSWLLEDLPDAEQTQLDAMVRMVDNGRVALMTSVITRAEVVAVPSSSRSIRQELSSLIGRLDAEILGVDDRVAQLAGELRHHYIKRPKRHGGKALKLGTPDALHLATAILYEASEFQTYDKHDNRGTMGLLGLDGDVAGHNLRVCTPHGEPHRELFDHEGG